MLSNFRSPAASPGPFESRDSVYNSAYNTSNDKILMSMNMVTNLQPDILQSDGANHGTSPTPEAQTEPLIISHPYNPNNQCEFFVISSHLS